MSEAEKQWRQMRDEYLRQIEAELTAVHHPRKKELLTDVRDHLERRFEELDETDHTDQQFQQILEEMGPAEEYAELLKQPPATKTDMETTSPAFQAFNHILTVIFVIIFFSVIGYMLYTADVTTKADPMQEFILKFKPDPQVLGTWKTVDYVDAIEQFTPGQKQSQMDFYLKEVTFYKDMSTSHTWIWSKGKIFHPAEQLESKYVIRIINGREYLFLEWISGDVTIRGMKPYYYVLKKE